MRYLKHDVVIGVVLFIVTNTASVAAGERRPNVILLMPDQMRGHAMGLAGNVQVHTPNLDRLARDGLYLPNTFANSPVCCPARATIMTGVYPHTHGLIVNDLRLRESERTLAEVFADAGYATAFVGKWHLDGGRRLPGYVPPGPRRQGFQYWAANECDHRHFDSTYFRDSDQPIPIKRFETEVWMDEAIRFIRANRDKPFFVWWACGPPHNPYGAPPAFEKMYDPLKLTMRPNWQEGNRWGSREDIARYYAAVTAIDTELGRLMGVVDELNLTDDTIVLFTSDHGDMLGSHGSSFKCKPWEESIRVPGIVRYPRRIKPGQKLDTLFSHLDFLPTLLSLCGIEVPERAQGRDLSARFIGQGGAAADPEAVFFQIYEPRPETQVPAGWRGVRTSRYTYACFEDGPWMLYDLEDDAYQLRNLVNDPGYADLRARLDVLVKGEMARTGDRWGVNCRQSRRLHDGPAFYEPGEFDRQMGTPPGR